MNPKTCHLCGQPFVVSEEWARIKQYILICQPCVERQAEEQKKEAIANAQIQLEARWEKLCPVELRSNDPKRLPRPKAFQETLSWRYGSRGLLLIGPTGNGKTRSLYALLKAEYAQRRSIRILDHASAFRYGALFSQSAEVAWEWVQDKTECDILACDDLFKAKLTDSFEQAVFTIISTRTEWGKPILVTMQDVSKTLLPRMSEDRGPALVRRLKEFCETISFA